MENGAKIDASPSHGDGLSTAILAAMQEVFATLSRNMANAISQALKSANADLEISYDEEIQEEDRLKHCPES